MVLSKILYLVAAAALAAPAAQAQYSHRGSVSFGWRGRHGSVHVQFPTGHSRSPRYSSRGFHRSHRAPARDRIWIPGRIDRVWVDPVYQTRYDGCGRPVQVLVRRGTWDDVYVPGYYEWRAGRRRKHY